MNKFNASTFNPSKVHISTICDEQMVAVYGSLKRGFGNHRLLQRQGVEFLCEGATVSHNFYMRSLGGFPGVIFEERTDGSLGAANAIHLELYSVNKEVMRSLDNLEGSPGFYTRELVHVHPVKEGKLDVHEIYQSFIYIINPDYFCNAKASLVNTIDSVTNALTWVKNRD